MASTDAATESMASQVETSSARAVSWATRKGYDGRTTSDLIKIAKIADQLAIDPTDLNGMEHLDRGAFGAIMKATYKGCPVAVKSIIQNDQDGKNGYSQDVRNVLLELAIVCRLSHPHVVAFYGMSTYFPENEYEDSHFHLGFVFELCSGGSLFSNLHELGVQFSFPSKLRILREVATGMSYLHQENIVHRDLSSRNILLTENFTVKIADFGCARKLTGDSYDSSTISGSPSYMPPEQLCGEVLTLKVDVWALGTMIWETICQKVPWRGQAFNSTKGLRETIVKKGERLPNPTEDCVPPGTHEPLVQLLKSTFEKKPALRPKMCQVLANLTALEDIVSPADWEPKRSCAVDGNVGQRPECPMTENPDTVQGPMGPARLEKRLRAYYTIFNPSKLRDVRLVATNFKNNQIKLNEQLRSRYNCDLWDMDEHLQLATPTPIRRKPFVDLPRNGSDISLDEKVKETVAPADVQSSADATSEVKVSSSTEVACGEQPAMRQMGEEELTARLEVFYGTHNPIKALSAKTIAAKFLTRQGKLNAYLKERYGCDLFDIAEADIGSLETPQLPEPCQDELPTLAGQPERENAEELEAASATGDDAKAPDISAPCEAEEELAVCETEATWELAPKDVEHEEHGEQKVDAGSVDQRKDTSEPQRPAPLAETESVTTSGQSETPEEQSTSAGAAPSEALDAPAAGSTKQKEKQMKLTEVVWRLRNIYAIVNPSKQDIAEKVVRKYKTIPALNKELQSKYGLTILASADDILRAAAQARAQAQAPPPSTTSASMAPSVAEEQKHGEAEAVPQAEAQERGVQEDDEEQHANAVQADEKGIEVVENLSPEVRAEEVVAAEAVAEVSAEVKEAEEAAAAPVEETAECEAQAVVQEEGTAAPVEETAECEAQAVVQEEGTAAPVEETAECEVQAVVQEECTAAPVEETAECEAQAVVQEEGTAAPVEETAECEVQAVGQEEAMASQEDPQQPEEAAVEVALAPSSIPPAHEAEPGRTSKSAEAETGQEEVCEEKTYKISLAIPPRLQSSTAEASTPGASSEGASTNGASQLGTHRTNDGAERSSKFADGGVNEERQDMDMDQLESRLRVFYQLHNVEKLTQVKAIAVKYFSKQDKLNETLRDKYCCDLWEVDEAAVCDSMLSGLSERSRGSSFSSSAEDDKERNALGKCSRSKTCSEADTEKCLEEITSDEDHPTSRGSSSSPALEPVSEMQVSIGTTTSKPKYERAVPGPLMTIAQKLHFLYQKANPTKVALVPNVLEKYKGNMAALNEELRRKYGVDLETPQDVVLKKYPAKNPSDVPVSLKTK